MIFVSFVEVQIPVYTDIAMDCKKPFPRIIVAVLFITTLSLSSFAQGFHFTQYREAQLTLNPAMTGAFYGDWRAGLNYRSQWGPILEKPYTTTAISFQKPIYLEKDKLAFGIIVLNDQAGDNGYNTNYFAGSFAYHMLMGNQEIRAGLQIGYTMKAINKDISFPNGFNRVTGEFDHNLSDDNLANYSSSHLDINFGAMYSLDFDKYQPEVGLAVFSLNGPKEEFFSEESKIDMKIAGYVSVKSYINSQTYVDPNFMIASVSKTKNFLFGARVGHEFTSPMLGGIEDFYGGLQIRNGFSENPDAVIIEAGAGISSFDVGISYDINISPLRKGLSSNGSFEISLIYTAPSTRLIKTKIESGRL